MSTWQRLVSAWATYEVIAPLGAGGMGRVYKVRNVISNRVEAMKILLPDFAADPNPATRFPAEISTKLYLKPSSNPIRKYLDLPADREQQI
jgi:serine/threonine protein kinase